MIQRNILLVDNEDSFTFNLVQLLEDLGASVHLVSGKQSTLGPVVDYHGVVFSPGPGLPHEFPLMDYLLSLEKVPNILGICLGMQAIALHYGAALFRQEFVQHGQVKWINSVEPQGDLFHGLAMPFAAGLYHSWAVREDSLPNDLVITCKSQDGVIMGLRHKTLPVEGVQFHPESFLTPYGNSMVQHWLNRQK